MKTFFLVNMRGGTALSIYATNNFFLSLTILQERISKNQNSDDEDGSILEDDADYNSGSRRSGTVSSSPAVGSSLDRKRASSALGSSSRHHGSSDHHHHSHHSHHHHHSSAAASDAHRRSGRDSSSSKRPHQDEGHTKGDNESVSDGEQQAKVSEGFSLRLIVRVIEHHFANDFCFVCD